MTIATILFLIVVFLCIIFIIDIFSSVGVYGNLLINEEKRKIIENFLSRDDIFIEEISGDIFLTPIYESSFIVKAPSIFFQNYYFSDNGNPRCKIFIPFFYKDIIKKFQNFKKYEDLTELEKKEAYKTFLKKHKNGDTKPSKTVKKII